MWHQGHEEFTAAFNSLAYCGDLQGREDFASAIPRLKLWTEVRERESVQSNDGRFGQVALSASVWKWMGLHVRSSSPRRTGLIGPIVAFLEQCVCR